MVYFVGIDEKKGELDMVNDSYEAIRILQLLYDNGEVPEDQLPDGYEWALLPNLVSEHKVKKLSILSPGKEPEYPYGLWAYCIDSAGVEVLNKFRDEAKKEAKQSAKENRRYFFERVEFWIGLVVGWLLGGFTPQQVFEWFGQFFH